MYKIENGKLVKPPKVWKGIIGYDRDLDRLVKDGWKPLIETGDGEFEEYVEHKDHIEHRHYNAPYDYKKEREKAYPPLGDVIDALLKAYAGDDAELQVIITNRQLIKQSIKKE
jgi:hypothetical protein